ncbi:MAG: T9SS type A sorting domain-containing protein [Bacteroidales bacterium]|jgi:Leucine-rich repeat (LRR) protein|nr:T9SS type A sorting domain-containing protein [Bacteroidales bacterium]
MKKIYILSLLLLISSIGVFAQDEVINFPDAKFKEALLNHKPVIDTNGDGEIQKSEANAYRGIMKVVDKAISSLVGIEYFTKITQLNCHYNQLTQLDVSKNTKLNSLICSYNKLTQLDVSKNIQLTNLVCYNNKLTQIDVLKNLELNNLDCESNQLTHLDVSKNTKLNSLTCSYNKLTQLDVSKNTKLTELVCGNNKLAQIDISKSIELNKINCVYNQLTSLNVSENTKLNSLVCTNNQITKLNIQENTELTNLDCYSNQLTHLDISKNSELNSVVCAYNKLTTIDLSKNNKLKKLHCHTNCIDLSNLWKIKSSLNESCFFTYSDQSNIYSTISTSKAIEIDYSSQAVINGKKTIFKWYNLNSELIEDESFIEAVENSPGKFIIKKDGAFRCQMRNPEFTVSINTMPIFFTSSSEETIDIPDVNFKAALIKIRDLNTNNDGAIQLSEAEKFDGKIDVRNSYIRSLKGIEFFTKITTLNCFNNKLTQIDVSKNTELISFDCNSNLLTQLDISKNTKLAYVNCPNNQLTQLDVSKNIKLRNLICSYNKLIQLDVSRNTELKELTCGGTNRLTHLDISKNSKLTNLNCRNNSLTKLNVQKNTELISLNCYNTKLTQLDVSKNVKLLILDCSNNQLTQLDISKNIKLRNIDCRNNFFCYSKLWDIKENLPAYCRKDYDPQKKIYKTHSIKQGGSVDYSSELVFNDNTTVFTWYNATDNSEVDETFVKTIEAGKFKFLKTGKYYCKMTNTEFDKIVLQTNTITVLKAQSLTFNHPTTIKLNDKITLEATASTGLDVTFELVSGKAKLDGNVLTATTVGTLVIKAFQAGNAEYAKAEKEVTIQVSKREQTITFDVKDAVKVNDKITLAATASSGLDVTYQIVSGNATLNGNTVTFTDAGKVQIKAKQAGNKEYKAVEKVVSITVTKSTAIDNLSVIGAKIYPNPVTDILNIELPTTGSYRVTVLNSIGDVVTQKTTQSVNTTIDMSAYNSGIYIIKVTTGNRSYTGKIIKQ